MHSKSGSQLEIPPVSNPEKPTISLVMIVKDEEENLTRALTSIADWVDEIIVVDTGSTDRTMDIARQFGARIYEHPWEDNFSLHRNQAIGYATCDWCLQLDADEELDPKTVAALPGILKNAKTFALSVEIYNLFGSGEFSTFYYPRLYRRHPDIGYHRRVHNQLTHPGPAPIVDLRILHYGYDGDEATMEKKYQRRLKMIKAWVDEEPDNWEAHFYYAQALVAREESLGQSLEEGIAALELLDKNPKLRYHKNYIYPRLCHGLMQFKRWDELARYTMDWMDIAPDNPDVWYFTVQNFYHHKLWDKLIEAVDQFEVQLGRYHENPSAFAKLGELFTIKSMHNLAALRIVACLAREDMAGANAGLDKLLALDDAEEGTRALLKECLRQAIHQPAIVLATRIARERPEWEWFQSIVQKAGISQAQAPAQASSAAQPAPMSTIPAEPPAPVETQPEPAVQPPPRPPAPPAGPAQPERPDSGPARSQKLINRAQELTQQNQLAAAVVAYEEAFALNPPGALQWAELAFLYANQNMNRRAEVLYRRALELEPGLSGAVFNLAMVLAKQGKTMEAREVAARCVELEPELKPAHDLFKRLGGVLPPAPLPE
jgi:glycosyltransferase involved in cell wall biosynthesis